MQCLGGSPGHCTSQHRPAPALHIVIFEIFIKSMSSCLSELKVTPSFCFPIKIRDNRAVTSTYIGTTAQSSEVQRLPSFSYFPTSLASNFLAPTPFGHLTIAFACFGCDRVVFFKVAFQIGLGYLVAFRESSGCIKLKLKVILYNR